MGSFRRQIYMTLTAILTHVDAVRDYPRALSQLVGRLLELARQSNASANRVLRGVVRSRAGVDVRWLLVSG